MMEATQLMGCIDAVSNNEVDGNIIPKELKMTSAPAYTVYKI